MRVRGAVVLVAIVRYTSPKDHMTPFECPNCNTGTIDLRAIKGRTCMVRYGVIVPVPERLVLPSCDHCNDYSVGMDREVDFDAVMIPEMYLHVAAMCDDVHVGFPDVVLTFLRAVPRSTDYPCLNLPAQEEQTAPAQLLAWCVNGGALKPSQRSAIRASIKQHLLSLV
jgi:predicted RNA-binding Zn-ribbon protein involved in translation (DUF1610 family)